MSTYTLWEAPPQIAKMAAERQHLPQMVNELFGAFIEGCGYTGYYTQPRRAGHQYFEFYGNTRLNKGYKVEIVMYYDELDITIARPIGKWHKTLRALAYTGMWVLGVLAIVVMVAIGDATYDWPSAKDGKGKKKKRRWKANKFEVHEVVALLQAGATLTYRYNDGNTTEVVGAYFEFFRENLRAVLKGERWVEGLPNVDIFGY